MGYTSHEPGKPHEADHLHPGPTGNRPTQGAAAVFRLLSRRLLLEATLRANRADLEWLALRQRVWSTSTGAAHGDHHARRAGAAAGGAGAGRPDRPHEATARSSPPRRAKAGVPYTPRTMSICSIEEVAASVDKPFWFQLYVMRDRGFVASLIERAAAAKCCALVLTVDLQILGQRHRDIEERSRRAAASSPSEAPSTCDPAGLGAPRATRQEQNLRQSRRAHAGHRRRHLAREWTDEPVRPDAVLEGRRVGEEPVAGKLIIKGILDAEDAKLAAASRRRRRSSSPTTAGASSTARSPRSRRCRRSSRRSAARSK